MTTAAVRNADAVVFCEDFVRQWKLWSETGLYDVFTGGRYYEDGSLDMQDLIQDFILEAVNH